MGEKWRIINPDPGEGEVGGWMEADTWCGFLAMDPPRNVKCDVTAGVPIRNSSGLVTQEFADRVVEKSVTEGGTIVTQRLRLRDPMNRTPSSVICREFLMEMNRLMKISIPGSRVSPRRIPT